MVYLVDSCGCQGHEGHREGPDFSAVLHGAYYMHVCHMYNQMRDTTAASVILQFYTGYLPLPLRGHGEGQCFVGQNKRMPSGCPEFAPVEQYLEPFLLV